VGRSASFKDSVVGRSKKAFKCTAHSERRSAVRRGPRNPVSKLSPALTGQLDSDASAADSGKLQRTVSWDISGASGDADKLDELAPEKLPV
jgi:hypothetical protein